MSDQAEKLRRLSKATIVESNAAAGHVPMVVVAGARNGVGATTVACNMAAAIADRGERVLLVDAVEGTNDLAEMAGVARSIEYCVPDIVSGKCGLVDAMIDGPMGLYVVANGRRVGTPHDRDARRPSSAGGESSRAGLQRLLGAIDALRSDIDLVVVDAGSALTAWTRRLWMQARCVVLVTTADDPAVMDAYAAIKSLSLDGIRPAVRLLVNRELNGAAADDAQRRVQNACQKFLSLSIEALPALPLHGDDFAASALGGPRVWEEPNSAFGRATLWLGRAVSEVLAKSPVPSSVAAFSPVTPIEMFMQATTRVAAF